MLRTQPTTVAPPPTYAVGEQIDAIDGVDFRASAQTLVMVLREDCRYCRESVPFYQKLTAANGKTTERALRVVVASTDAPALMSAYLKASEVQVDQVAGVRPGGLKVPGTPFLVLVDANGTVTQVWRGKLGVSQEQELFALLGLTVPN